MSKVIVIVPMAVPSPIVQGTIATTAVTKFGSALHEKPINIRQLGFSSANVTEDYVAIIIDGIEKAVVLIK